MDIAVNILGNSLETHLPQILADAAEVGVSPLINIGSNLAESSASIELCQRYPRQIWTTAGTHPHHASQWQATSQQQLRQLCQQPGVVAVGECGLDYNRDFSPRDKQRHAFAAQLELACELGLPVLMHERDAHDDFLAIVSEYRAGLSRALLHCFTGTREHMQAYIELDLYLGITGWVCDERRGKALTELVKDIPGERILIETDSPYLLPRSMRPKPKSSKNEPKYLPFISQTIADLRQESAADFAKQCYRNSQVFFNLD
ncbi:TatD family hydrolase [Shewanella sp. NIFS-20-20]|uniref:TatD family hydrolase n=1 Tax=Shewanella sp. NIFS-20-20 TaxID=2853806 RepID=UPI001C45613E|nr:TatD family hydrolase [Shewanella sp. NIFS-20-20]MBV7316846.1 TatD family hydrolase [Shewanella sp. NIFS-20-20]